MRPHRRAASLVLGAGVLYLIGTNAQAGWLFVLAVLLLGAAGAGAVLPATGLRGLRAEIIAPTETRQGEPTAIQLRISNAGRATRWGIVASDAFLGGATSWVGAIRPGETVTLGTMRDAPRRGEAHPGWVELSTSAPFGVAERRRRLPVEGVTLVLPRVIPIGAPPFIETSQAREPSLRTQPRRGPGAEYLGVREYRPGDPIRQVHWRLTARHGELVVRDLEQERMPRLAIWVDTSVEDEALDRVCTAAASIVDAATATGAGVRLLAAGPDGPIAAARTRAIDIHRWLARLEPSTVAAATALGWIDTEALRGVGTVVIVIGRDATWQLAGEVGRLARAVPRIVIVPTGVGDGADDARAVAAAGAQVWPWRDDQGLTGPSGRPLEVPA